MRVFVCHSCKKAVQVGGKLDEVASLVPDESVPCITPLCNGRMLKSPPAQVGRGYATAEIPVRGFFRAINGFGTGLGDPASFERLRELLLSEKVVDMVGEPVGQPERVIIRELILENGTRLHFEASSRGACIYYIEEPSPSCVEVVEDEIADGAARRSDSDREEAGRAPQAGDIADPENKPEPGAADSSTPERPESGSLPPVHEAGELPDRDSGGHGGEDRRSPV